MDDNKNWNKKNNNIGNKQQQNLTFKMCAPKEQQKKCLYYEQSFLCCLFLLSLAELSSAQLSLAEQQFYHLHFSVFHFSVSSFIFHTFFGGVKFKGNNFRVFSCTIIGTIQFQLISISAELVASNCFQLRLEPKLMNEKNLKSRTVKVIAQVFDIQIQFSP